METLSMSASTITKAITSATGALLEGNHRGALTLLESALTFAKLGLDGQELPILQSVRKTVSFQLYALPLETEASEESHQPYQSSICPGSLFSFYNAAIISPEMEGDVELAFAPELSAVVLYNLALVYHRSAIMTGSTPCFLKAVRLYNVAASIVLGHSPENSRDDSNDETMVSLQIALYVNMGHIYSNFMDIEGTIRCARGILDLYRSTDWTALTPAVRTLFHSNLFATQHDCHPFSLAPAA
jgi:hypothetical protein